MPLWVRFDILGRQDSLSIILAIVTDLNDLNCGKVRTLQGHEKGQKWTTYFTRKHVICNWILQHYLEWGSSLLKTGMMNIKIEGTLPQPNEILVKFCKITLLSKRFCFSIIWVFWCIVVHETFWMNPFYDILFSESAWLSQVGEKSYVCLVFLGQMDMFGRYYGHE